MRHRYSQNHSVMKSDTSDRPTHPIKMIALDLDGTLLRKDKTVGPRTKEALREAHRRGIEVVLASGRMTPAMERTAEELDLDCCIVSYNGAAVVGRKSQGRNKLVHQPLDPVVAKKLFDYAKARDYQVNYYLDDVIHSEDTPTLRPWIDLYKNRTGSPYRFVGNLRDYLHRPPTKFLLVTDASLRAGIESDVRPMLGESATVIRTDPEYLEFLDPRVDKGWGVVKLAGILGIPTQSIMAMGDGENDISMLRSVGWGVAVKNALPPCKEAATAFTENDNENDAVAEAVEKWVL